MNFNKKLAVAVSGAVLLMAGQFALADSATDIVDALVSKGVLTEEEGKLITKGHTSKTAVTPVVKEKDGAFILESANARNSIQLTGRMHLDYRHNNMDIYSTDFNDRDSASVADGWELRRARLGVKGVLAKDFKYEIVGNLPGTATVDVAYLDFAKYKEMQIRMGKFKQPFNLEELTSSNNIDFMERSYVNQLAPAKKIGAMIFGEPKDGFTYALSTFSMNDSELDSKNDKASFAGRSTLNFAQLMGNKEAVMHVGIAGFDAEYNVTPTTSSGSAAAESRANILAFRTPGRGLSSIFRAQIGGDLINNAATSTSTSTSTSSGGTTTTTSTSTTTTATQQGAISNSTSQVKSNAAGLEGAIALKNFKLQGEYTRANYSGSYNNRAEALDMDVKAMYGEVMWLVTGEKYADAYKAGTFGAIKPISNFDLDTNQWGAWEVGFRMEKFDVNDIAATLASTTNGTRAQGTATCTTASATATSSSSNINGCSSKSTTYTAGVKWILNPNLMVKFNYSRTNFGNEWEYYDLNDSQRLNKENIYMMRTQYAF